MNVTDLQEYKRAKKKQSKHDENYTSVKNKLMKWTIVHETGGNKFTIEEMQAAIDHQTTRFDGPRCTHTCCYLWAIKYGNCVLHDRLLKKIEKRNRLR
jgi:hypothetical protein